MMLDEHFSRGNPIAMEGPLYGRIESKKVWKRYHFVLRPSGIYYYPKDKTKSPRNLLCHSIFIGHEIYKGIGWKKKHKAPTDFTFALKSQQECIRADTKAILRNIKIMCAEDNESLDRWITAIRVAKYGKRLLDSHRTLVEDLAREDLDKLSPSRSVSIGSIVSAVTLQCSSNGSNVIKNNELKVANNCVSCASSSCSNGCLSDENNVFDRDFPTGTIKRKPSMKPNLPLTSMTRQLKEVGKNTFVNDLNPISSEKSGTLTRLQSRKHREENIACNSNNSSIENMKSSNSITVVETCIPGTVGQVEQEPDVVINNFENEKNTKEVSQKSPLKDMPPCMTDSMFSLPPPPEDNASQSGSKLLFDTFPPPPTPSELIIQEISVINLLPAGNNHNSNYNIITSIENSHNIINNRNNRKNSDFPTFCSNECYCAESPTATSSHNVTHSLQSISTNFMKPPYKSPPPYTNETVVATATCLENTNVPAKNVTFADSSVPLRREIVFEDGVNGSKPSNLLNSLRRSSAMKDIAAPMPPPRAEATRLSTSPSSKRLSESNPPRDFLNSLNRVMRKKWQVAQKCKLEPTTTPYEVLGFRDFANAAAATASGVEFRDTSHYYRETSNVSNWVQEHYGSLCLELGIGMGLEQSVTILKPPAPPPPKRNTTTQLTKVHLYNV